MNKNTAKAIKVVKDYMKRTGAKIICGDWGTPKRGCFLTLYLAAHGHKSNFRDKAIAYWGGDTEIFAALFDGDSGCFLVCSKNEIRASKSGTQAREAFKKELGL